MTPGRIESTALADLASNVFAVCLITLLLLTALDRARPAAPARSAEPLVLERDLHAVRRAPLAAADLVEVLRARRPGAPGASIDVGAGLRLTRDGATRPVPPDAVAALASDLASTGPVRLYVFGHDGYASLARRLEAAGIRWTEISIPVALRREAGSADWSPGFLALLDRADDPGRFREGLTRLLAGGRTPESLRAGGPGPAMEPGLLARWRSVAGVGLEWTMLVLGAMAVLGIERGRARRRASETFSGERGLL